MKILLLSLVTIFITSCSVFGVGNIEEPNYEVVLEEDSFQVRKYPEILVAQTTTTGDYKETAKAIASEIGIEGKVLTGEELNKISDEDLTKALKGGNIHTEIKALSNKEYIEVEPISNFCGMATVNPVAIIDLCAPVSDTITYEWSFPGGSPSSASTLDPGTITYSAAGNYTVSLSVTNSCGTTTDDIGFVIAPIPIITNIEICAFFTIPSPYLVLKNI